MIKFFKSFFAWELVQRRGVWGYYRNTITGKRKAKKLYIGHSMIDNKWLETGRFSDFNPEYSMIRTCAPGTCPHCNGMP